MSDTAPQPPPRRKKLTKNIEDAIGVVFDQRDRIADLESQLAAVQQANVMARDIADQAHQRALKAERELAEAQARLAMAVEALKASDHRIWEHHEVGHIERAAHRAWGKACEICSKESPTIFARNQAVLDATAEAVAQHTASVERRGAAKGDRRREVKLGVIEFHSDRLNPGLRQRFYEVVDDLKRSGSIVDVWLLDISRVLAEFGYEMHVYSSVEPDNSTVKRAAELEGA